MNSGSFLLFAAILKYCLAKKNTYEDLTSLTIKFSNSLVDLEAKKKLANHFRNKKDPTINWIYNKIITKIIKDGDNTITFHKEVSERLINLFNDNIVAKYPLSPEVINGIDGFISFLDKFVPSKNAKPSGESTTETNGYDADLINTKWYFYYHEYAIDTPFTNVSRLLLHYDNSNHITLYDNTPKDDFTGKATIEKSGINSFILIINLERKIHPKKNLQIRVVLTKGVRDNSIYMGQYIDVETRDSIVSGTFIIENTIGHSTNLKEESYKSSKINLGRQISIGKIDYLIVNKNLDFKSNWEYYIPKPIAQFLAHKWMNFTKTRTDISDLKELKKFAEKQNKKLFRDTKFNNIIEYDAYLITPVESLIKEELNNIYSKINSTFFKHSIKNIHTLPETEKYHARFDATDFLKSSLGINRIYYPTRQYNFDFIDLPSGDQSPDNIIEYELPEMRKSKCVIFIMPDKLCTSALVKLGCAIQMEKKIFIFPLKKNVLPKMLTMNYKDMIMVSSVTKIERIPQLIEVNFSKHFKERKSL